MSWSLGRSEWPNIPTTSVGLLAPFIYGTHNSSGLSGTGMLAAIPVSYTVASVGWYVACAGEAKEILAVFLDGVDQSGNYTVDYSHTRAGRTYTLIKFTGEPTPASVNNLVTFDAHGYEDTGNTGADTSAPSGVLISNPVEQIKHLLINHAEKGWMTGAWYTDVDSSVIDTASWAECVQWAENHQLEGAGYVGGGTESKQTWDIFNEWLGSWQMFRAYWTAGGRLGLRVLDIEFPGYRQSTDHPLLMPEYELGGAGGSAEYDQDTSNLTDTMISEYLYDEVQQKYLATLTAIDPDGGSGISSSSQMPWSARRVV